MKKGKFVTGPELAGKAGKTKQSVHKSKSLPYIIRDEKRFYDLNDKIIKKWLKGESITPVKKNSKIIKSKPVVKKKSSKKIVKKKIVKAKDKKVAKPTKNKYKPTTITTKKIKISDPFDIPDHLKKLTDSGQLTFAAAMELSKTDLERIKIYEQIKEIKVKADERREGLIPKKLIRTVFSKLYEIDMNQFLNMKDKLIPDIAATLGVIDEKKILKASEILDNELWKILGNIKRVKNKFLKSAGEKEI